MNRAFLPYLALFVVQLIYGANYVIAKGIMPNTIGPNGLVFCRICGAVILFWIVFAFQKEKVERKDFLKIFICAFFGVFLNQFLFINGLNLTSPINASLIMITIPISVFVLSISFFGESISWRKLLGLVLATGGFIYLVLVSNESSKVSSWQGDLMCAVNAVSYALYLVLVKSLMKKYKPLTVLSWMFLMAAIIITPLGVSEFNQVDWGQLSTFDYSSVLYVVVFVTFVVYFLNIYALTRVSPTIVATFTYAQPIAAGFFSWLYFVILNYYGSSTINYSDEINAAKLVSALLICSGVYFVAFQPKKPQVNKS